MFKTLLVCACVFEAGTARLAALPPISARRVTDSGSFSIDRGIACPSRGACRQHGRGSSGTKVGRDRSEGQWPRTEQEDWVAVYFRRAEPRRRAIGRRTFPV